MITRLWVTGISFLSGLARWASARCVGCAAVMVWLVMMAAPQSGLATEWRIIEIAPPGSVNSSAQMPVATVCSSTSCETQLAPGEGPVAPNGLPDGHVAIGPDGGTIAKAWYAAPTERYRHAILGDAVEAGRLVVEMRDGTQLSLDLPQAQVFEDRTPRLIDLEGFGQTHIVTILAEQGLGASVAIFGVKAEGLVLEARSKPIGRANRWLNIAGLADFDGDGRMQIAAVETPHIGGTLKFWMVTRNKERDLGLELSASARGFSNHQIGAREQQLSASEDFDGDGVTDLAVPSDNRRTLRLMRFTGRAEGDKQLVEWASIPLPSAIDKAMFVRTGGTKTIVTLGLDDGSVHAVVFGG